MAFQVTGGPPVDARCQNISLGGLFIETDAPAPFGAEVVVRMRLPSMKTEVELPAIVRWVSPTGMGLQLGLMGARETHALTELLAAP